MATKVTERPKPAPDDALGADLGLTRDDLLAMYSLIVVARAIDERMWVLNRAGKIPFVISGQGHEGAQVGIAYGLQKGLDWMVPYYRSVASLITFGMTPREIMLAQFARSVDPSSGGRQMPGHYGVADRQILSVSSPVATQILHATGIALAAKLRKTGQVTITYLGEGSSNQGDFHEALNFAGIHKLPVVYVVENNGYAISVPMEMQSAVQDIAVRGASYAMPGIIADGAEVLECYRIARRAIDRARAGEGPTLIEAKVTRMTAPPSDQQTKYRSAEDLESGKGRDPLPRIPPAAARRGRARRRRGRAHHRRGQEGRRGRHGLGRGAARPDRRPPNSTSTPTSHRRAWMTRTGRVPGSWATAAHSPLTSRAADGWRS